MDRIWRFLRTVAWTATGLVFASAVVLPLLKAVEAGDWPGAQTIMVVGGLTTIGSGIVAVLMSLVIAAPTTVLHRVVNQVLQVLIAGAPAPVIADTLFNTSVDYGRAWASLVLVAIGAGVQAWIVNTREAAPNVDTPAPTLDAYQGDADYGVDRRIT